MNKKYWAILILAGVALSLAAVPRNLVVVEVATRTSCPACYAAAVACNALLSNGHPVAIIKNHTGGPIRERLFLGPKRFLHLPRHAHRLV